MNACAGKRGIRTTKPRKRNKTSRHDRHYPVSEKRSKIPKLLQFSFPLQQFQSDTVRGTSNCHSAPFGR